MIKVSIGKSEYNIPSSWGDFSVKNNRSFILLAKAFDLFERGKMPYDQLRVAIPYILMELDASWMHGISANVSENLFRLSEHLDFPVILEGNTAHINVVLRDNLIPKIKKADTYVFNIDKSGVVNCNLTARQYVDAVDLANQYSSTRADEPLAALVGVLCPNLGKKKVSHDIQVAMYYNFRGILEYIKRIPDFEILFASASDHGGNRKPSPLGSSGSIFSLVKEGYGTLSEIENLDMISYLSALAQMSIDGIYKMRSAGAKPVEISEKLDLPVELVYKYIEPENN